jgi:uncharacterized repeat protein (TIGR03803 family)
MYGVTFLGPTGLHRGTAFRTTLDGTVSVLHAFSYADGWEPHTAPVQARDGNLYGTAWYGGGPGKQGVLYRLALP